MTRTASDCVSRLVWCRLVGDNGSLKAVSSIDRAATISSGSAVSLPDPYSTDSDNSVGPAILT